MKDRWSNIRVVFRFSLLLKRSLNFWEIFFIIYVFPSILCSKLFIFFLNFQSSASTSGYLIPPDSAGVWEQLSKGKLARVFLPHNQKTVEAVVPQMTVNELLLRCCKKRKLDHEDHFIRIRAPDRSWIIPSPKCTLESLNCQDIEVCIKEYHAVTLSRNRTERFGIEYETVEERLIGKELLSAYPRLFVRDVLPSSIAQIGGSYFLSFPLLFNIEFFLKSNYRSRVFLLQ